MSRNMNAKQLKAAFYYKTPVFSDDKEYPVKLGYVAEVIYSLSDSGKRKAMGKVQQGDNSTSAPTVLCRHIHFSDPQEIKMPPASEPNEHTEMIKNAFLNTLPVVAVVPNVGTVEGHIKEIIYWRSQKGNIQCSANILDVNCPRSTVKARLKYIQLKENGC